MGLPGCCGCLPPPLKLGLEDDSEFPVEELPGGRLGAVVEPDGLGAVVVPDGLGAVVDPAGLAGVAAGLDGVALEPAGLAGVAAGLAGEFTVPEGRTGAGCALLAPEERVPLLKDDCEALFPEGLAGVTVDFAGCGLTFFTV